MKSRSLRIQLTALVTTLAVVRAGHGAPGDVMTMPAPMLGADPPAATALRDGDASVSTQTGALQYAYPITVPPGRLGMEPKLAISYSSQASVYGGVAAGWSLSVPMIERDTADGILDKLTFNPEDRLRKKFVSSLAGSRPLIEVDEGTLTGVEESYRAQNDTSFMKYDRMALGQPFQWRVRAPDGTIYYFGDASLVAGGADEDQVPLTRQVDALGNTIEYAWVRQGEGIYLSEVRYTSNPALNLPAFATVRFTWSAPTPCASAPVGSQTSFRSGFYPIETGARRLDEILITVGRNDSTRRIALGYDATTERCDQRHAPYRQLVSIQESATSATTGQIDLPAVRFTYGTATRTDWVSNPHGPWDGPALTYGRRSEQMWPTVESMLTDVDGDGLVDRLRIGNDGTTCVAHWERNNGASFGYAGTISLPHLPWGNGDDLYRYCSLNGQHTRFQNVPVGWCGQTVSGSYLSYRWMDVTGDGLTDLVTAIHHDADAYDPLDPDTGNPFGPWPSCEYDPASPLVDQECFEHATQHCTGGDVPCTMSEATYEDCVGDAVYEPAAKTMVCDGPSADPLACESGSPGGMGCDAPQVPFEVCGRYPWIVYENLGNGVLGPPAIKLNPIPLESFNGDSPSGAGPFSSAQHAMQDLDGDGLIDAILKPRWDRNADTPDPVANPPFWYVWKGDGTGGFRDAGNNIPFFWYGPNGAPPSATETEVYNDSPAADETQISTAGLADLNGDGLPDYYWQRALDQPVEVYWNRGSQFSYHPDLLIQGPLSGTYVDKESGGSWLAEGYSSRKTQLIDFDDDGRTDLQAGVHDAATQNCASPAVRMRYGDGVAFLTGLTMTPAECIATNAYTSAWTDADAHRWQTTQEFVDLDGDGSSDRAWVQDGQLLRVSNTADGKPARLLTRIENGQGLHVDVKYASLADPLVVTTDPTTRRASPQTKWIVAELVTTDDHEVNAQPERTTYRYRYPRWSEDDRGDWAFRGFDVVRATNPGGGVTEERYDYDVDWSGRLERTLTFAAETGNPTAITDTQWQRYTLFGGAVETFHPRITRTYACAADADEGACVKTPAGFRREETVWTALANMYVATRSYLQDSEWFDEGDRYTDTTYAAGPIFGEQTAYRIRETLRESKVLVGTQHVTYAKSETVWDPSRRMPLQEKVWSDAATVAVTQREYNSDGTVKRVRKPEQLATNGPWTWFDYDSTRRFVTRTTNEYGHVVDATYDSATGAELRRIGPNAHPCNATNTCGSNLGREERRTDVDALGRPIRTYVTRDAGVGYALVQVGATSYVDTSPASMTTKSLIDFGGTRWTEEKTTLDGHGRPIHTIVQGGLAPAETRYDYDHRGKLVAVTLPDPSNATSSPAYVTYTYTYDSVGRATGIRRPDATGVDLAYDGVTHTRREVAGAAGGPEAITELIHDGYGRLVTVNEHLDGGGLATTIYGYDAGDRVAFIDDPDGVTTELEHDWAGRRVRIDRETRSWVYKYDRNGNLTSEQSPYGTGLPTEHITSYSYDALDRVTSRNVAGRGLDWQAKNQLGIGEIVYFYDGAPNATGRLTRVETRAVGQPLTLERTYQYDAEGNVTEDRLRYRIAGIDHTRRVKTAYGPGGKVVEVDYGDGNNTDGVGTRSRTHYDGRAAPVDIEVSLAGGTWTPQAKLTRNIAGGVTLRRREGSPAQEARWSYDPLGRVISQDVVLGNGTQIASQKLAYFGTDDPRTLEHKGAGLSTRSFTFAYDRRHQLTGVTTSQGTFGSSYGFLPSGRLATATVAATAATGSDVVPRDVEYIYQATDPEMVSALRNANGTTFATYDYDGPGNITRRVQQGQTTDFLWDGDDQLRRATSGNATEEYFYDDGGQRVAIVKRSGSSVSEIKLFLGPLEVWLGGGGSVQKRLAHVGLGTPIARVETNFGSPQLELQYHSTLQSLLATVRPNATSADAAFVYGPYGEVLQSTGSQTASHRRRYNDKHKDELTSWSYYGYRYYDPTLQTWTSADPLYRFSPDMAWNEPRRGLLYLYKLSNPQRYLDPDGLDNEYIFSGIPGWEPPASVDFEGIIQELGRPKPSPAYAGLVNALNTTVGEGIRAVTGIVPALRPATWVADGVAAGGADSLDSVGRAGAEVAGYELEASSGTVPDIGRGGGGASGGGHGGAGKNNESRGGPPRDNAGNYVPDRGNPTDRNYTGVAVPRTDQLPHTTLGQRTGSDGKPYTQGATFDSSGTFRGRTDVSNHGRRDHAKPHWHPATGPASVKKGSHRLPDADEIE